MAEERFEVPAYALDAIRREGYAVPPSMAEHIEPMTITMIPP